MACTRDGLRLGRCLRAAPRGVFLQSWRSAAALGASPSRRQGPGSTADVQGIGGSGEHIFAVHIAASAVAVGSLRQLRRLACGSSSTTHPSSSSSSPAPSCAASMPEIVGLTTSSSAAAEGSSSDSSASSDLAESAAARLHPATAPALFRAALVQGFAPAISGKESCFSPEVHGGDRQKLIQALKRCRLLGSAAGDELDQVSLRDLGFSSHKEAYELTRSFITEVWREAVLRGLALGQDGTPMRAAAAEVAKAFLSQVARFEDGCTGVSTDLDLVPDPSSHWTAVGSWLSEEAEEQARPAKAEDFAEFVSPFWREQLARADRSDAVRLLRQLGGDDRFGWLRNTAGATPTGLFKQALQWKSELPECVLLVQVGDFFEAWGVDAVMMVQWCGLNPMARKPRAGFPVSAASLQQALDNLTRADLSAAVIVQTGQAGQANQPRVIRQVVTPGAPTYLHAHELKRSRDESGGEFHEGRPYVAMRLRTDGLLYAELRPYRREIRFREDVTPEGVESLLAENEGIAWPVFVDGAKGSFKKADKWPWFPKQRKWMGIPQDVRDDQFLEACCRSLCETLRLPQNPPFLQVRLDSNGALQPLSLTTARNLGVLPRDGVPALVSYMVPPEAPAAARRLLRRWLLAPRSEAVVNSMRQLLAVLLSSGSLSLPPLHRVPPVAKVVAFITAQTANERLFRDLHDCCTGIMKILQGKEFAQLLVPLLAIVAEDIGEQSLDSKALAKQLLQVTEVIDDWLHDVDSPDEASAGVNISDDAATQRTVERFFEANEVFRGVASQDRETIAAAYSKVELAKSELCDAIREALPDDHRDALVYNPFDNDLCFREKHCERSSAAHDRRGKAKNLRFTTPRLRAALERYIAASRAAENAVQEALRMLSAELGSLIAPLRSAVTAAEILVAAHRHAAHAGARGWQLPKVAHAGGPLSIQVAPYWLEASDAVFSRVDLSSSGAIATGPNMSGKSTLMRSVAAAALLANCGFLCPCSPESRIPRYRQVFFLAAEGDRPSEGVSAFGQEAQLSGSLLRRACGGTLALVDEFGRGTEPMAAQAAVCALVEELARHSAQFVVATHLHGVADVEFQLPEGRPQPALWRMGVTGLMGSAGVPRWTYVLEEGVCRDSFAWHTLRKFGWSESALSRFHRLSKAQLSAEPGVQRQRLPPAEVISEAQTSFCEAAGTSQDSAPFEKVSSSENPFEGESELEPSALLAEICGVQLQDLVRISPGAAPPAPLCQGTAVLYMLRLRTGGFYIGQTDFLQGRLASHRRRFTGDLEEAIVLRVETTARARQLEALVQRKLLRAGVPLVSSHDSSHRNFGLGLSSDTHGERGLQMASRELPSDASAPFADAEEGPEQLRRTAQYLLALADKLQIVKG
ncbi:unnamed protein product [Polarella glacialis]|uniref:DNA mismatch repair proteins mutS family domain-containing protein n=1 Tax=Polarella glacialis TaxID=89957 RepID=A0A813G446_POLGL|nr:unnamed protein product [Polarella glacialis]